MPSEYPNLGQYQVLEEIGRGGMGAVYKGRDPLLNRAVAQLRPPNIIDIYDVGQAGDNYYNAQDLALSPDGKRLVVALGSAIKLWDAASGQELTALVGHSRSVNWVVFSPDGTLLATTADDNSVRLWGVR